MRPRALRRAHVCVRWPRGQHSLAAGGGVRAGGTAAGPGAGAACAPLGNVMRSAPKARARAAGMCHPVLGQLSRAARHMRPPCPRPHLSVKRNHCHESGRAAGKRVTAATAAAAGISCCCTLLLGLPCRSQAPWPLGRCCRFSFRGLRRRWSLRMLPRRRLRHLPRRLGQRLSGRRRDCHHRRGLHLGGRVDAQQRLRQYDFPDLPRAGCARRDGQLIACHRACVAARAMLLGPWAACACL